MVTHKTKQQQSRSVAKRIWVVVLFCLSVSLVHGQDFSSIAGTWTVRFGNGVGRVYKIASDGAYSCVDAEGPSEGNVLLEEGRFVIHCADGRVQRVTKLADTLLKVEAFGSAESFAKGEVRTTGTGVLKAGTAVIATPAPATPKPAAPAVNEKPVAIAPQATPMPPSPPVTDPVPIREEPKTEQLQQQAPQPSHPKLTLSANWNTPMQGGSNTMEDLARLFGGIAKANVDLDGDDQIIVYERVPYLAPISSAVATLKLNGRMPSKNPVVCPGFPRDSFFTYAFDGRFEEGFNRLYLIVDRADQLVGVHLVEESPKSRSNGLGRDPGWRTYNFVLTRTKAINTLTIRHRIAFLDKGAWKGPTGGDDIIPKLNRDNEDWNIVRVDSILAQTDPKSPNNASNLALKEVSRWYVPKPVVALVLTCIQKNGR